MAGEYCTHDPVKKRLLIETSDATVDTDLDEAIVEACRVVDIFMKPYATVPLTGTSLTDQIAIITADFAASIFKRRWIPNEQSTRGNLQPDMLNDLDGSGWFAVALRRMQDYIKSFYTLYTPITAVVNPEIYSDLMKRGVITPLEARALMVNDTLAITNKIDEVMTRTLTETTTKVLTDTVTKNLTEVDDKTLTDVATKTLTDTKTLTETATKGLTQSDTITKDQTLIKDETNTKNETVAVNKTTKDISVKSNTELQTVREYKTKKQNAFIFVRGNGVTDGHPADHEGYEDDTEAMAA